MCSYIGVHAKQQLFLCDFKDTSIFSTVSEKIVKYQISGKIRPVGPELFHADGRKGRQT